MPARKSWRAQLVTAVAMLLFAGGSAVVSGASSGPQGQGAATVEPGTLGAQGQPTLPSADVAAAPPQIFLATYGPGEAVWEKFGHNAIWVRDARTGETRSYNWGMFSFNEPGFVPRLMRGSMRYWMMPQDASLEAGSYVASGRAIRLQELVLEPALAHELAAFLQWNARPENRYYDYDYFRDNCSTRVRDAIDRATGGRLQSALTTRVTSHTYRSESLRLTASEPLVFTGLELGMADPVDQPLNEWELGFIPMRLADAVAAARVPGPDGAAVPIVRSDTVLFAGAGFGPADVPDRTLLYLLAGVLIGAAFVLSAGSARQGGMARVLFALLTGLFFLLVGIFGLLLALLWAFTGHVVTYGNENLFQVNPLALLLALLAPLAPFAAHARRGALLVAGALAGISVLGLVAQLFPAFDQYNRHILALMVPAHLGALWGVYRLLDSGASRLEDEAWRRRDLKRH
jgi:hypothetical protein